MAIKELQERLKTVRDELSVLAAKAQISEDEDAKIGQLIDEGSSLKARIEQLAKAGELLDWSKESAGMLPVAAPSAQGTFIGAQKSGEVLLQNKPDSVIVNYFGEPTIDPKVFKAINDSEYTNAMRAYIKAGGAMYALKAEHIKLLQEGSDIAGGFTVPPDALNRIIAKEPAPQTVASRVSRMNTSRDVMVIPKVRYTTDNKYTTAMAVTWTGEVPASAGTHEATNPEFGEARIPIYTAMISLPLTNDLIEDSSVDLIGWVTGKFQETVDLLFEDMILNGTGTNQPSGILVNPNGTDNPATVASGNASALTWDGIQNLAFALPEQYDRNAGFYMNKTNTALALSKLKDGDARPLWTVGSGDYGLSGDRINKPLLGYPVTYNAFMPNVSAGAYPIVFGDLSGYYLVTRVGFSIQVLREIYAQTNKVLILGRVRFGGKVIEDWRMKIQTVSAS